MENRVTFVTCVTRPNMSFWLALRTLTRARPFTSQDAKALQELRRRWWIKRFHRRPPTAASPRHQFNRRAKR